jgi:hypothetical protein
MNPASLGRARRSQGSDLSIRSCVLVPTNNSVLIESVEFERRLAVGSSRHVYDHLFAVFCASARPSNASRAARRDSCTPSPTFSPSTLQPWTSAASQSRRSNRVGLALGSLVRLAIRTSDGQARNCDRLALARILIVLEMEKPPPTRPILRAARGH